MGCTQHWYAVRRFEASHTVLSIHPKTPGRPPYAGTASCGGSRRCHNIGKPRSSPSSGKGSPPLSSAWPWSTHPLIAQAFFQPPLQVGTREDEPFPHSQAGNGSLPQRTIEGRLGNRQNSGQHIRCKKVRKVTQLQLLRFHALTSNQKLWRPLPDRERPSSFLKALLSHLYSTLLPQVSGRQQTDCAGAHHGNLTPPRVAPSCPHCLRLWLDRSIIIRLLTRVGPVLPAAMRNSPPQAVLWTDRYRSAPFLAVFDAGICTGGLGASSSVALALSQGPLVSGRIPLPDMKFSRNSGARSVIYRYSQYRANWARMLFNT